MRHTERVRLLDKVAVVTGVSSGIGLETARRLVREGACVVGTSRRAVSPSTLSPEAPERALWLAHDVTSEADWRLVIAETQRRFGRLDVLVNNAGIMSTGGPTELERATLDEWRAVHAVNVEAVFLGCRGVIPAMRLRGGSIVNVGSIAGRMPTPAFVAYGASKAALTQLTRTVAQYCATLRCGIRCNSIAPGLVETPLGDEALTRLLGSSDGAARESFRQRVPLGVLGQPADVASAVVYLASEESRFITGTELVLDGGRLL